MAETAVASGLMPHQKDEHDIWTCKDCGWKYPNAKPSSKIRKHHKKQCPGKSGAHAHAAGGSSDEASDDDHHHTSHKGSEAPNQAALDVSVPSVETKSRDFDFGSVKEDSNGTTAPAAEPVVNGSANEAADHKDAAHAAVPIEVSTTGLMPHQKDENDIWICKACGWKYPNAKPSSKIRKNHKKHCPGSGGHVAAGGSSDEASDDEHHHEHHDPAPAPVQPQEAETPTGLSKEIDLATLKESPSPKVNNEEHVEATPTAAVEPDIVNGLGHAVPEKAAGIPESVAPEAAASSGLMLHQKDEHDVWVCKDCGWKYPNAKPSPKIRKHHKKKCTGKAGAAAEAGGSSDDASDGEHHHSSAPAAAVAAPVAAKAELPPAAPVDIPPAVEPAVVAEVPGTIPKEMDFAGLKDSSKLDSENETTALRMAETIPAVAEKETPKEAESEPTGAGVVTLKEAIHNETHGEVAVKEKEDQAKVVETGQASATEDGGLMPHQKHEGDIWICKECGWKYPNAKPSAKVRNNHKKKCPKLVGTANGTAGGTPDASYDDDGKLKGPTCFPCL